MMNRTNFQELADVRIVEAMVLLAQGKYDGAYHRRSTRGAPMDQAALVEHQIDDVPGLIDQLGKDKFDVKAAFWLYTSEADQWFLYLVSDLVNQLGSTEAYKMVYQSMRSLPSLSINPFEVKLVGPDEPIAKEVLNFQAKMRAPVPTRVRGSQLGRIYIENAYIYYI
jgi:hypothetical protein